MLNHMLMLEEQLIFRCGKEDPRLIKHRASFLCLLGFSGELLAASVLVFVELHSVIYQN